MKSNQSFYYYKNGNIEFILKTTLVAHISPDGNQNTDENISYAQLIKKYNKDFDLLSKGIYKYRSKVMQDQVIICLIDKTLDDFENYCKKNKLPFREVLKNSSSDLLNYQPKESKEKLKSMNKKLIKRIAVASLACFLAVPTISNTPVYATLATTENVNQELEQAKKDYENDEDVRKWNDYLSRVKKGEKIEYTFNTKNGQQTKILTENDCKEHIEWAKEDAKFNYEERIEYLNEILDNIKAGKTCYFDCSAEEIAANKSIIEADKVKQAQVAAEKAEAEAKANKVYELTANTVEEFLANIPEGADDEKPHYYTRADLPGVTFTLTIYHNQGGSLEIRDTNPHLTFSNIKDYSIRKYESWGSKKIVTNYYRDMDVSYISPFEGYNNSNSQMIYYADTSDNLLSKIYGCGSGMYSYIGENKFSAHRYYKTVDENGKVTFDASAIAFSSIEGYNNYPKCIVFNTPNKLDTFEEAKKKMTGWIEQWEAQGHGSSQMILSVSEYKEIK